MIRENQKLLNQLNVLSDALILFCALPLAFWIRFYVMPDGLISVSFSHYLAWDVVLVLSHLFTYAALGLYRSLRHKRLLFELKRLWLAGAVNLVLLIAILFLQRDFHYSRMTFALYFFLSLFFLSAKRVVLRKTLHHFRGKGYNLKHVLIIGSGTMACRYLDAITRERYLGYHPAGYVACAATASMGNVPYEGDFDHLEDILDRMKPDEIVCAIELEDYSHMAAIISAAEHSGTKISLVPFYSQYMPSNPQFDELAGIPMLNIRRIPLDNWANAFLKRTMDIVGSLVLIILTSPIMLICAVGVKLSSPGPIIFKQQRVGRNKQVFSMYKFRSMRLNDQSDTAWSSNRDDRKTKFGSFIRKCSLDELPQFFNVLKGEMSLVGPRPELPHFVDRFKDEVPLYMVKHQVRPGITGWAQVNGLRGDTSIKARVKFDIDYIEHWSLFLDVKILLMTVFGGKFLNSEHLK